MTLSDKKVFVAIDESNFSFIRHRDLVAIYLNDLRGMSDITISNLTGHDVEDFDSFRIGGVNDCHDISGKRDVSLV
jgi:hypothetical protein